MQRRNTTGGQRRRRFSLKALLVSDGFSGYVFVGLWIIGFLLFTIYPMLASLYYSFTKFNALSPPEWVGLKNYITMFTSDPRFKTSFFVTLQYALIYVPLRLGFALIVAMMFKGGGRLTGLYRTVFYIPSVIGGSVAVAVMWRQMFGFSGIINQMLVSAGIITEMQKTNWLGDPRTALWTLILLAVWQFGSPMLIFLAGLKQIPVALYEAADIDGANAVQKFFRITLPALSPVIFFNLVMQVISGFMAFTQAFIITEGKPHDRTLLYVLYLYQKSFQYQEMGYGSAMAWFLLVVVGVVTALIFRSSSYWVYYETKGDM